MKRSFSGAVAGAVCAATLLAASPALADTSTDAAGAGAAMFTLVCMGLLSLLGLAYFVLWIWMLVDALSRQEWEYPGSSGNSKIIWVLLMVFLNIATVFYYFMVYRKVKRGTTPPPAPPGYAAPAAYAPPAPAAYAPPAPPAPPAPEAPPAPPAPPSPPAPPVE
ncbi:MAG: PLDc N-terminal domain-containing protein [Coriobacteriia bacterium]